MVMVRLGNACANAGSGKPDTASPAEKAPSAARRVNMTRSPSNPVPMRNLDHAGALRKLFDQRVGGGAVIRIEIGIPFVEQIDRRLGMAHDLVEGAQLPLAGREACLLR